MTKNNERIIHQSKIFKALGHPSRLLMVDALRAGEMCVCELQALIGDDMSTISKHLSILKAVDIISSKKRGTNIYYTLTLPCLDSFLTCTGELPKKQIFTMTKPPQSPFSI